MARDTEKNAVFTVTVPRNSQLFTMLSQEAEDTGIAISKLIVLRASDFYKSRGLVMAVAAPTATSEQPATASASSSDEPEMNDAQAALNAEDAFDAW